MSALRLISRLKFISPRRRIEWYPPFWLMRIKVLELADDFQSRADSAAIKFFFQEHGDAMFGGHQASLADPVAALACAKRFPGNSVWTRSMTVDFMREGNSDLELRFEFPEDLHNLIANDLREKGRSDPTFEYGIFRADGKMCTRITNTVAIRPRNYSAENLK